MRSLAVVLLASAPVFAQESAGAKVYKQAVASVVWIHSARDRGLATGSGSLVDKEHKLVLTNYHVVEENPKATVFFPQFRDGQPIPERDYYSSRKSRLGIDARVIALDKKADLAVLQLRTVPDGVPAIKVAANSPGPGDSVHNIGNAGKSGALFGYVRGTVRQVYRKSWKAQLDANRVIAFQARVIETDSPTNPGDSGGPLLSDAGELIGVTQGGAVNANSVSTFVDVSEVRELLSTKAVRDLKPGGGGVASIPSGPAADKPAKRAEPVKLADGAKLFSADAMKAAEVSIGELHKKGVDVLVETYATAPAEWKDKAKAATPEERRKFFREWAADRLKAEKANGLAVLVCMDPRYIAVEIPPEQKGKFPDKFAERLGDILKKAFGEKKFDAGLADVLAAVGKEYRGEKK